MAKIAVLCDTHWGCRSDNQFFYDNQKQFIDKVLLPTLDKYEIKHLIHLGDVVDNRRNLNVQTARRLHDDFLMPLMKLHYETDLEVYFILGNHDIYYRDSKDINAFQEVLRAYPFQVFEKPQNIFIDGKGFLMLPWITPSEREATLQRVFDSQANYCMSHLELKGFEQTKGRLATHGDDPKAFAHFDIVFSGHYHTRSRRDNIFYIGSAFQFNWGDVDNHSGLVILDTDDNTIVEIENPYSMFNYFEYDEDLKPVFPVEWQGTFVRVNIVNKKSEAKFNKFVESIHQVGVADLSINENLPPLVVSSKPVRANSTLEIFSDSINSLDISCKDELKSLTTELYWEAMSLS